MKKRNKDSEMEVISIELINPQHMKVEGLMIHYGSELGKADGRVGCSTTMMFVSNGRISKDGIVYPEMRQAVVRVMREFWDNYVNELEEALKCPIKIEEE